MKPEQKAKQLIKIRNEKSKSEEEEENTTTDKIDGIIFDLPLEKQHKLWDLIELLIEEETELLKNTTQKENKMNIGNMSNDEAKSIADFIEATNEEKKLEAAFIAGWNKSKTALLPKVNHYAKEYIKKVRSSG